jgi:hypothetical protein
MDTLYIKLFFVKYRIPIKSTKYQIYRISVELNRMSLDGICFIVIGLELLHLDVKINLLICCRRWFYLFVTFIATIICLMFLYLSLINFKMIFALFHCRSVFREMKLHDTDIFSRSGDAIRTWKDSDAATRMM